MYLGKFYKSIECPSPWVCSFRYSPGRCRQRYGHPEAAARQQVVHELWGGRRRGEGQGIQEEERGHGEYRQGQGSQGHQGETLAMSPGTNWTILLFVPPSLSYHSNLSWPNLSVDVNFSLADGGKQETAAGTKGSAEQEYPGRRRESGPYSTMLIMWSFSHLLPA